MSLYGIARPRCFIIICATGLGVQRHSKYRDLSWYSHQDAFRNTEKHQDTYCFCITYIIILRLLLRNLSISKYHILFALRYECSRESCIEIFLGKSILLHPNDHAPTWRSGSYFRVGNMAFLVDEGTTNLRCLHFRFRNLAQHENSHVTLI